MGDLDLYRNTFRNTADGFQHASSDADRSKI